MSQPRKYGRRRRRQRKTGCTTYLVLAIGFFIFALLCCGSLVVVQEFLGRLQTSSPPTQVTLTLAYSPEKGELLRPLVEEFNAQKFKAPSGLPMVVELVEVEPELMIERAVQGEFQAINPDSSIWLDPLDRLWAEQTGQEGAFLAGWTVRYAVSPVVIAMWRDVAQEMGYPDRPLGWSDLLARAEGDPNFKWSHPSTSSASGLLATLAEFYAGVGKTWGLTTEDVQAQATLDYVAAIEKTIRYYGEGEWAVVQQVLQNGPDYLDAFVCQEQLVVYANQRGADLVAIYPVEGSLWEDHPLVLLELPDLTNEQRLVFARLAEFLRSPESQQKVLAAGYRPADPTIPLDGPGSPLTPANGVDPTQPKTALQIPGQSVIEVVRNVWWYTKRHTNVYLVVDVSGSMRGEKLANVKEALRTFVEQIKGPQERVGLIVFSSDVEILVPLDRLERNREDLLQTIEALEAHGDTALLDGVDRAYEELIALNDQERINGIVVMTDGLENASRITLGRLADKVQRGNAGGESVPVVIFAIAYGDDADMATLRILAQASGGQAREGTLETIRQLYKILSTYF